MKNYHFLLLLFFSLNIACEQQADLGYHWRVLKEGDNKAWAAKKMDDRDWDKSGRTSHKGVFWIRFNIDFGDQAIQIKHKGLNMISIGSYEAYWDGVFIGANGKVGKSKEEEIAGTFISHLLLPDSLVEYGRHTLALRVSNHHAYYGYSWNTFYLNEYEKIVQNPMMLTALMYLLAGIYLIVGIYYLFLYFHQKKNRSIVIFSLLCFSLFALILLEYLKFTYYYPYHFHFIRLLMIGILTFICSYLTIIFFLHYFQIPHRKRWSWGVIASLILINVVYGIGFDVTAMQMSLLMWAGSLAISIYAWVKRKSGAVVVFIAFLFIAFLNFIIEFDTLAFLFQYDVSLFVSYTILIVAMLYLLAQQQRVERNAYEESLLLSARLKTELLKKNIQPHFIMNTLTSLIDWVEESPKEGIKFMEALAREFQLFSKMADERLIPIEEEIELCKKHLEIMSYRKEIQYEWQQEGIDESEQIPPAILHTVIENGITHSLPDPTGKIRFLLKFEQSDKAKIYTLSTFAKNRKKQVNKDRKSTGLNYIQSRLKESYGMNWWLNSYEINAGWETKIGIRKT